MIKLTVKDDYYQKQKEFQHWLLAEKGIYFNDLEDSKDQLKYFKKFVKRWNKGKLDQSYYNDELELFNDKRSKHEWNLKNIVI
jgi:hypothetical protein